VPDSGSDHEDEGAHGWTIAVGILVLVLLACLLARDQLDYPVVATLPVAGFLAGGRATV
jgi:hypothetical protein